MGPTDREQKRGAGGVIGIFELKLSDGDHIDLWNVNGGSLFSVADVQHLSEAGSQAKLLLHPVLPEIPCCGFGLITRNYATLKLKKSQELTPSKLTHCGKV